ncbi:hypothetical protein L6164_014889 [Bauhinia variegata]|uniref:Uncharacterized protein n=1 Tax=Bauhinia variegata TaxID=167791 RepID=A0ACB9NJI7_BAUVA|nr:hypothetical protein L6164_014889 [Bauhinia variegata]
MDGCVKKEVFDSPTLQKRMPNHDNGVWVGSKDPDDVIELSTSSSSSSDSDPDDDLDNIIGSAVNQPFSGSQTNTDDRVMTSKRRKANDAGVVLPLGFLNPLPLQPPPGMPQPIALIPGPDLPSTSGHSNGNANSSLSANARCKQFWKAGDYEGAPRGDWDTSSVGMDHVRVHPKFLHSNATSHKWALGAFAELLDNSVDEVCNGATYVNVDMILNKKDGSRMLLIEDNGGGMDPDKMRQCMSLGYSVKSRIANTIGQYGNGFKTSTMRLGADVIVFSRCSGKEGQSTQSIGLLSYTFLRSTGKEDIVVPMLDYEREGGEWNNLIRSSLDDWNKNVETIVQWSPFFSEADLLRQFNMMKNHGTRIIIYNLWEDDQGQLELDFDADPHDIQIRGVNRDEKNIQMAREFPNSRHFLTYRHSLRSYASILYLRLPPGFRIILRGKDVMHHNIVNDMMLSQEVTYKPQGGADGAPKDPNIVAIVTVGFVKDAVHHIDVSGFNVYHKNRLIKPFWRIWNPAGSGGRGVIGVLEANFVEPAHDKQGFERTTALSRLEAKLVQMQKNYWNTNCHKIGYVSNRNKKKIDESADGVDTSPDDDPPSSRSKRKISVSSSKGSLSASNKLLSPSNQKRVIEESDRNSGYQNGHISTSLRSRKVRSFHEPSSSAEDDSDEVQVIQPKRQENCSIQKTSAEKSFRKDTGLFQDATTTRKTLRSRKGALPTGVNDECEHTPSDYNSLTLGQLKEENRELKERLEKEAENSSKLLQDLQVERDRCQSLESELQAAEQKIEVLNKEQDSLINIFSEERERRDAEEKSLRNKLEDASNTIQELLEKVRLLERRKYPGSKPAR